MPDVRLTGCAPEPLAGYLKALALLRLVALQKDAYAKGWWERDVFHLESVLDHASLARFFLEDYQPTPLLAPWGARSGFYAGSSETSAREALEALVQSPTARLAPFREAVTQVRILLQRHDFVAKPKDEREKLRLMRVCRSELAESVLPWLDAVYALSNEWRGFAPLLGTGANEGSQGYSSTFAQMLIELEFHKPSLRVGAEELLQHALFGRWSPGLVIAKSGQHDPGRAGGFNQGPGIEQKAFPVNPWAIIFSFEGSLLWSTATGYSLGSTFTMTRKGLGSREAFCSPFTVRPRTVGYTSSDGRDKENARAEIWVPLWERPVGLGELQAFLNEGRAEVGRRRARHGLEFAEAAASLGVDRGVAEFARYTLLKRRGDSYVALPAGRFPVRVRQESELMRELDPILNVIDRFLRDFPGEPPAGMQSVRHGIEEASYSLLLQGGGPRVKRLIAQLGRMEKVLARRDLTKDPKLSRPISGLSPRWLVHADDGSVEVRLAAALASISPCGQVGPLRANLAPVDPVKPWGWAQGRGQVSWSGNSLAARLGTVLSRRMMDAERLGCGVNPLRGALSVHPEDVAAFIEGDLNEGLVEDLLFGFTWIRWTQHEGLREARTTLMQRWAQPVQSRVISRAWALLKLLFLPGPIQDSGGKEIRIRPEPSIISLLRASRVREACQIAERRLSTSGLAPIRVSFPKHIDGGLLAGALLLPVRNEKMLMRWVLQRD